MRGGAILQQPMSCVGVDVSKHHLDVAFPGTRQVWRTKNDVVGIKALAKRLAVLDRPQLVCEVTGGYTRALVRDMAAVTTPMSRINPRQVGDFARATGKLAKTDAIDAGIILQFAETMQPPASPPPAPEPLRLSDLVRRRRQLVDAAAIEKQRDVPSDEPLIGSSVKPHLAFLKGEIETIDQTIALAIDADQSLARRAALLRTIPGVGTVTAATLVAELPELGHIGKKQIAALIGVAPINQDSGLFRGQAHIAGGRQSARCCLSMATIVAIRCNPAIRPFYKHLRDQGKPPKVAIVAIVAAMRKLIITANAMLQNDRPWIASQT